MDFNPGKKFMTDPQLFNYAKRRGVIPKVKKRLHYVMAKGRNQHRYRIKKTVIKIVIFTTIVAITIMMIIIVKRRTLMTIIIIIIKIIIITIIIIIMTKIILWLDLKERDL